MKQENPREIQLIREQMNEIMRKLVLHRANIINGDEKFVAITGVIVKERQAECISMKRKMKNDKVMIRNEVESRIENI